MLKDHFSGTTPPDIRLTTARIDRKSTRLNSSHGYISYAVFCLKKKRDPRLTGPMTARMGLGDTAVNLAAAGLVLNAWMLTGDPRYRDWIEQYAGAWRERAAANHGVIPDNVGPDGVVGSLLDGRWYGGHYGWSWPHGWYSVGSAAAIAALAAATATGDDGYLDLLRPALDTMIENGKVMAYAESDSSLASKWH